MMISQQTPSHEMPLGRWSQQIRKPCSRRNSVAAVCPSAFLPETPNYQWKWRSARAIFDSIVVSPRPNGQTWQISAGDLSWPFCDDSSRMVFPHHDVVRAGR